MFYARPMVNQPTGAVTFLFTDIEGSTRLWEERPDQMRRAVERHDQILTRIFAAHDGYVFSTGGDSFATAFSSSHRRRWQRRSPSSRPSNRSTGRSERSKSGWASTQAWLMSGMVTISDRR